MYRNDDARAGRQLRLTLWQEQAVQKAITDTTPDQLKRLFALSTRVAMAQLIERRCGIALPVRTMGHYLARWGFTARKPPKRAYEQRPEAIAAWLKTEYPRIKRRAPAKAAEIHRGDETGLSASFAQRRSFAPKGRTLVRTLLSARRSVSLLSAISNAVTLRFMV